MNEYIILHDSDNYFHYIPTKYIQKWKIAHAEELCHGNKTLIYFHNNLDGYLCVKESPSEIEALIMGYELPEFDEVDDSCKNEPTFSLRENALKDDIEKLKEENAKLKDQLARSNPANPCCRETYLKARERIWKRATSYEPKLKNCLFACTDWEIEFDRKIQEIKKANKND